MPHLLDTKPTPQSSPSLLYPFSSVCGAQLLPHSGLPWPPFSSLQGTFWWFNSAPWVHLPSWAGCKIPSPKPHLHHHIKTSADVAPSNTEAEAQQALCMFDEGLPSWVKAWVTAAMHSSIHVTWVTNSLIIWDSNIKLTQQLYLSNQFSGITWEKNNNPSIKWMLFTGCLDTLNISLGFLVPGNLQ